MVQTRLIYAFDTIFFIQFESSSFQMKNERACFSSKRAPNKSRRVCNNFFDNGAGTRRLWTVDLMRVRPGLYGKKTRRYKLSPYVSLGRGLRPLTTRGPTDPFAVPPLPVTQLPFAVYVCAARIHMFKRSSTLVNVSKRSFSVRG